MSRGSSSLRAFAFCLLLAAAAAGPCVPTGPRKDCGASILLKLTSLSSVVRAAGLLLPVDGRSEQQLLDARVLGGNAPGRFVVWQPAWNNAD